LPAPRVGEEAGGVREPVVVEAVVALGPGADRRAVGGAVTRALCGAFEHPGPCPLAPHRTTVAGPDEALEVRVVAACEPGRREVVLRTVAGALAAGSVVDPDGVEQRWRLRTWRPAGLHEAERDLAERLAAG
jgi:hypothetical protein